MATVTNRKRASKHHGIRITNSGLYDESKRYWEGDSHYVQSSEVILEIETRISRVFFKEDMGSLSEVSSGRMAIILDAIPSGTEWGERAVCLYRSGDDFIVVVEVVD